MLRSKGIDAVFTSFISRLSARCAGKHSIFLSILPGSIYQPVGGNSKINPANEWITDELVLRQPQRFLHEVLRVSTEHENWNEGESLTFRDSLHLVPQPKEQSSLYLSLIIVLRSISRLP